MKKKAKETYGGLGELPGRTGVGSNLTSKRGWDPRTPSEAGEDEFIAAQYAGWPVCDQLCSARDQETVSIVAPILGWGFLGTVG